MGVSPGLVNDRGDGSPAPRIRRGLFAAAALCLLSAGAVLWWREGEAIFSAMTSAAVALCF